MTPEQIAARLATMAFNYATTTKKLKELAKKIDELIRDLGDPEYETAQRLIENAGRSPNPMPIIHDAIGHLYVAANNFEKAANKSKEHETKLDFLFKRCVAYHQIASYYLALGERNNALEAAEDFASSMLTYHRTGRMAIQQILEWSFGDRLETLGAHSGPFGFESGEMYRRAKEKGKRERAEKIMAALIREKKVAITFLSRVKVSADCLNELKSLSESI
jgi:tetratricopeptide (TPR) repeat protein